MVHGIEASVEDSWFPGYGWRIVSCGMCGNHLGWLFTATPPPLPLPIPIPIPPPSILPPGGTTMESMDPGSTSAINLESVSVSDHSTTLDNDDINLPDPPLPPYAPRFRGISGYNASRFVKNLKIDYFW